MSKVLISAQALRNAPLLYLRNARSLIGAADFSNTNLLGLFKIKSFSCKNIQGSIAFYRMILHKNSLPLGVENKREDAPHYFNAPEL